MAMVVVAGRELPLLAAIAAGAVSYGGAVLLVRALHDEDRRALVALLNPVRVSRART